MTSPAVSIVIPTLHRADCIGRAIQSVVAQTYTNWELIVVDGASGDGTREIVNAVTARDPRVRLIERANGGVGPARNIGIDAAQGRYVAFLDSDDEFLPTKIERQMALMVLRPALGLVYSDYSFNDLDNGHYPSAFDTLVPMARRVPSETVAPQMHVCTGDLFEYLVQEYFIATIVGLVRRDVLADDLRFWEQDMYGGEWMFYLEVSRRCSAGFIDEPLCLHHFTRGSISRTSRIRNTVYLRRLLYIMRDRFASSSPAARRHIRRQLHNTCRQLGYDSHKSREYAASTRYFAESLTHRFEWNAFAHVLLSAARCIAAGGRPGTEPLLRPS